MESGGVTERNAIGGRIPTHCGGAHPVASDSSGSPWRARHVAPDAVAGEARLSAVLAGESGGAD